MEMEVTVYTIDNEDYILLDQINDYLYLSNENDASDMMIRKVDHNDEYNLLPLDNEEEFDKALLLFTSKNIDEHN